MDAKLTAHKLLAKWFARHGTPAFMQSDNATHFTAELQNAFMRASQTTQVHSTAHHPATNGLVERQNRTLLNMLRVFTTRRMRYWDQHIDEVLGAYNSTRHASTGFSPYMLLTGHEKSIPLSYIYPEFAVATHESHEAYVRSTIKRQQEIHELVRRNLHQAQLRQKKYFDRRVKGRAFAVGDQVWVFCNVIPIGGSSKLLSGWRGPYEMWEYSKKDESTHSLQGTRCTSRD